MLSHFVLKTFETFQTYSTIVPHDHRYESGAPFPINDPFGLRMAVVPVFESNLHGTLREAGTAFHIDGWGQLLTAEHVVDCVRNRHSRQIEPGARITVDSSKSLHPIVLLGYGHDAYGIVGIPDACWARVHNVQSVPKPKRANAIAELRGDSGFHIGPDIAAISVTLHADAPAMRTLPLNFNYCPQIGESVLAIGFPTLKFNELGRDEAALCLNEGIHGAYGTVTGLFPEGRGEAYPSPVFEVDADWRSGMSGGPVFNHLGEVIGIVSSSIAPNDGAPGRGYASCFAMIREASELAPTLDHSEPGRRRGFCIYNAETFELVDVTSSRAHAESKIARLPPGHIARQGSHRMGDRSMFSIDDDLSTSGDSTVQNSERGE